MLEWVFLTVIAGILGGFVYHNVQLVRFLSELTARTRESHETLQRHSLDAMAEAHWKLVLLANEALATLKAGSIEQKVATDIRVQQSRVELEQLKDSLRSGHSPKSPVPSKHDTVTKVWATTSKGQEEVDLNEYDILT